MVSPPVAATVAPPVLAAMVVLVAMLDQARLVMVLRARPPVLRPTPVRSWRAPRAAMAVRVLPEAMVEPVALPVAVARTAMVATLALPATVALVAPAARAAQLVPLGVMVAPVRRAARGEVLVPGSALLPPPARMAPTATAATAVTAATPRMPLDPQRVAKEVQAARLPRPVEMVVRVDRVVPPIQLVPSPPRAVWAALVVHLRLATPAAVVPAVRQRSAAGRRQRPVARVVSVEPRRVAHPAPAVLVALRPSTRRPPRRRVAGAVSAAPQPAAQRAARAASVALPLWLLVERVRVPRTVVLAVWVVLTPPRVRPVRAAWVDPRRRPQARQPRKVVPVVPAVPAVPLRAVTVGTAVRRWQTDPQDRARLQAVEVATVELSAGARAVPAGQRPGYSSRVRIRQMGRTERQPSMRVCRRPSLPPTGTKGLQPRRP